MSYVMASGNVGWDEEGPTRDKPYRYKTMSDAMKEAHDSNPSLKRFVEKCEKQAADRDALRTKKEKERADAERSEDLRHANSEQTGMEMKDMTKPTTKNLSYSRYELGGSGNRRTHRRRKRKPSRRRTTTRKRTKRSRAKRSTKRRRPRGRK